MFASIHTLGPITVPLPILTFPAAKKCPCRLYCFCSLYGFFSFNNFPSFTDAKSIESQVNNIVLFVFTTVGDSRTHLAFVCSIQLKSLIIAISFSFAWSKQRIEQTSKSSPKNSYPHSFVSSLIFMF